MSKWVLDASALLALLNRERGDELVGKAIADGAAISTVNFSEVVTKLSDFGVPEEAMRLSLNSLGIEIVDFDIALAYRTGLLRTSTKSAGLSLGDRACLALAQSLNIPALTADKAWNSVSLDVSIQVIR